MGRQSVPTMRLEYVAVAVLAAAMLRPPLAADAATEVAHWSFDGCLLADVSGAGHDLTSSGDVVCVGGGQFSEGMSFSGSDAYLSISDASAFRPHDHAWSVAAWLRTSAAVGTGTVLSWVGCNSGLCLGGYSPQYVLRVTDGHPVWFVLDDDLNLGILTGSASLADGQWHFLVGTLDPSLDAISLYVDGVLAESGSVTLGTMSDALGLPFSLGRQGWPQSTSSYRYLTGQLDEVRVYDGLLTNGEIAALYANNSTPVAPASWGSIKALYR